MSKELRVLRNSKPVTIEGGCDVDVRELSWPQAISFLEKLGDIAKEFAGIKDLDLTSPASMIQFIPQVEGLSRLLLTKATDLSVEQIDELGAADYLELMTVALELNMTEKLLSRGKKVAALFAPQSLQTSVRPSTSLSGKDTPTETSNTIPFPK